VAGLLSAGRLDLGGLVTHRFPLDRHPEAIEALRTPAGTRGKVLVDIGAAS
jgi:threonine dehydrogenase-like Zn-dependent dehydrogenase